MKSLKSTTQKKQKGDRANQSTGRCSLIVSKTTPINFPLEKTF